jgi:hypothetical protein
MSEAEVSLRLALYLIANRRVVSDVAVAIDGAQVKVRETQHFDVVGFLRTAGWVISDASGKWQGTYRHSHFREAIVVHSRPGSGDVTATLVSGEALIVEAKKGPLGKSKSSSEYPLLREALGQLLTLAEVPERTVLAVAVPHGTRFAELATRWRNAPLVKRAGIGILTVSPQGEVSGW